MRCRTVCILFALLALGACVRPQPVRPAPSAPQQPAQSNPVALDSAAEDAALAAQGRGRLDVVVRPADRPTQGLPGAVIDLRVGRDTLRRQADDHGRVSFTSLDVGNYDLLVRAIGYGRANAVVTIKPGCRTSAEAFIGEDIIGLGAPAPRRGQVTIKIC